jgi:integrative and conjugative element protein (TIGR02256 family)
MATRKYCVQFGRGRVIQISLGNSGQNLVISDTVLDYFTGHRQTKEWHCEAGGQLFAVVSPLELYLCQATGPRPNDKRARFSYLPDRLAEQFEIKEHHRRNLQYIGDWHTHPESVPRPSSTDYRTISSCFRRSEHSLNAFLLAIIGVGPLPSALHLSLHDSQGCVAVLLEGF